MLPDGISRGLSNSNCATTSFANSIGMEGKNDMTSNDNTSSSDSMVMPCIWFMNVFAFISAYGDWWLRGPLMPSYTPVYLVGSPSFY